MLFFEIRWNKEPKSPEWLSCHRAPCELSIEPHFLGTKFQRDPWLCRGKPCAGELELLCFPIFNFPAAVMEWEGCKWEAALILHAQPCSHGPVSQNYPLNPVSPAPEFLQPESCCEGSAGALTLAKLHIPVCFPPLFSYFPVICSQMLSPSSSNSAIPHKQVLSSIWTGITNSHCFKNPASHIFPGQ